MRKPFDLTFIPFPSATLHVDSYLLLCLVKDAHSVQASKSPTRLFTGWFQRDRGRCNRYPPPTNGPDNLYEPSVFHVLKLLHLLLVSLLLVSFLPVLPSFYYHFFLVFFNIRIQRRIILRNRYNKIHFIPFVPFIYYRAPISLVSFEISNIIASLHRIVAS